MTRGEGCKNELDGADCDCMMAEYPGQVQPSKRWVAWVVGPGRDRVEVFFEYNYH